ncbi:flagellar filament capping protein FliD, partial [Cronobacter sakazakii]|uniref:flagellar filament capping protein FliD n=1 Tax=Cronobacter sakazakii TaxID=28141 RepID=UPI0013FD8070
VSKASDGHLRLTLTSKTTGTSTDMTVTGAGDDTLQGISGFDSSTKTGALCIQTASQNANVVVNDNEIEHSTNVISDALPGAALTLKAQSTANETLSVTRAADASKKAVTDWVTAYNALQSTIASVTKCVKVDKADTQASCNGALIGDRNVRSIQSQLRSTLTQSQSGSIAITAQLGMTRAPVLASYGLAGGATVD